MNQAILEFLIPAYKRFNGALNAANSIASQVLEHNQSQQVHVRVVDDGSPGFSEFKFCEGLVCFGKYVKVQGNKTNKGMSRNIYDMVKSSRAEFCTILTDDDWLQPGKLLDILEYLDIIRNDRGVGGIFTPRHSYLENGSLQSVVLNAGDQNQLISSGPLNSLKYARSGFILTGFLFRPDIMAAEEWLANMHNGYFPVINFSVILSHHALLYVNQNWFHHTVLNRCHWESWGKSKKEQAKRLYRDYMAAVSFLASKSFSDAGLGKGFHLILQAEISHYTKMLQYEKLSLCDKMLSVSFETAKRPSYWITLGSFFYQLTRDYVGTRLLRTFRRFRGFVMH